MAATIKKRDGGISFAKFIATFLVMNSHMGICYAKYKFLATGGALGNALFFFISGFTLFLGVKQSFPNFFKRRLARIYPVVVAMAIVSCLLWNNQENFIQQLTHYWFINCIVIYYLILWLIRHYEISLTYVTIISLLISTAILVFGYNFEEGLMYGNHIFRYFIYFTFMAFGAKLGTLRNQKEQSPRSECMEIYSPVTHSALRWQGGGKCLLFSNIYLNINH